MTNSVIKLSLISGACATLVACGGAGGGGASIGLAPEQVFSVTPVKMEAPAPLLSNEQKFTGAQQMSNTFSGTAYRQYTDSKGQSTYFIGENQTPVGEAEYRAQLQKDQADLAAFNGAQTSFNLTNAGPMYKKFTNESGQSTYFKTSGNSKEVITENQYMNSWLRQEAMVDTRPDEELNQRNRLITEAGTMEQNLPDLITPLNRGYQGQNTVIIATDDVFNAKLTSKANGSSTLNLMAARANKINGGVAANPGATLTRSHDLTQGMLTIGSESNKIQLSAVASNLPPAEMMQKTTEFNGVDNCNFCDNNAKKVAYVTGGMAVVASKFANMNYSDLVTVAHLSKGEGATKDNLNSFNGNFNLGRALSPVGNLR